MVKNLPANTGDVRDAGSIPESGRSPAGGHGHPLQCSCPENPMNRGAWQAASHRVTWSWTWLNQLSMHACSHIAHILFLGCLSFVLSLLHFSLDHYLLRPVKGQAMWPSLDHKMTQAKNGFSCQESRA